MWQTSQATQQSLTCEDIQLQPKRSIRQSLERHATLYSCGTGYGCYALTKLYALKVQPGSLEPDHALPGLTLLVVASLAGADSADTSAVLLAEEGPFSDTT